MSLDAGSFGWSCNFSLRAEPANALLRTTNKGAGNDGQGNTPLTSDGGTTPFSQGEDKNALCPNEETGEPPQRQPPEPPQDVPQAACTTSTRDATSTTIGTRGAHGGLS